MFEQLINERLQEDSHKLFRRNQQLTNPVVISEKVDLIPIVVSVCVTYLVLGQEG